MKSGLSKALVTGGAGFIGSHLVDTLVKEGCDVVVLDDLSAGSLSNLKHVKDKITFYKGNIQDQKILMKAAENCEVIFHQAALVSVTKTVDNPVDSAFINDLGTLLVLDAGRKNKVKRVVFASSSAVYGDDPLLPKHESMQPKPMSPYAVQKLTGELYAHIYYDLYGIETVCLRYFNVYGPRQDASSPYSGVISIFMAKAVSKKPSLIYGDGKQYRDFVFVKDVVKANLLAATAEDAAGQTFNIGTGKHVSINTLWDMICLLSGLNIKPEYAPPRPGDIIESVASIEQAKSALGFKPDYSFEKGLEITFKWYKDSRK
ncbi:MAG: SDR family oxidoreductase [Desulfobacteraceae bacterium]|nr:SDR family oxidoreductase [Pseudomonadota bacterium]MBU4257802.1 SDR family oxidoreductase [Pseudomonadota bacterium]MCG2758640.1 SDR family oxidoreductase [Desulfobacteraceae bacterium]